MSDVKPIPDGFHSITPHLIIRNAAEAIEFYKKAFGANEHYRMPSPDGKIMHAELRIGNSIFMIADEYPEWGSTSPQALNGTPVNLMMYVEDVDAAFGQAVEAGAEVLMPVTDMFWGDRYCKVKDPFGHEWELATHTQDLTPEEIAAAAAKAFSEPPC